jgi:hypothetical protein
MRGFYLISESKAPQYWATPRIKPVMNLCVCVCLETILNGTCNGFIELGQCFIDLGLAHVERGDESKSLEHTGGQQ